MMFSLVACSSKNNSTIPSTDDILSTIIPSDTTPSDNTFTDDYELMNKTIVFKIANTELDVYCLDNNSVKELKKLVGQYLRCDPFLRLARSDSSGLHPICRPRRNRKKHQKRL